MSLDKREIAKRRSVTNIRAPEADENARLRKQNDELRAELKRINETLNQSVGKLAVAKKVSAPPELKDEALRKEIDNASKQNLQYKKEINKLRNMIPNYNFTRIEELQNQVKEKDKEIESLRTQVKFLEKEKRGYMSGSDGDEKYQRRIAQLTEDLEVQKKKLSEAKRKEQEQEKTLRFQQEFMIKMQEKAREKEPSAKRQQKCEACAVNEEKLASVVEQVKVLTGSKQALEKKYQKQIELLKGVVVSKEKALQKAQQESKNMQKSLNILNSRAREASNRKKIDERVEAVPVFDLPTDVRVQYKGNTGGFGNLFNDVEAGDAETKLERVKIGFKENRIVWMQTSYRGSNSESRTKLCFNLLGEGEEVQFKDLMLGKNESIVEMRGYYSRFVEFLEVKTSKDTVVSFGSAKNREKCKPFELQIRKSEAIAGLLGGYADELCFIGVALRMKKVVTKGLKSEYLEGS